MSILFLRNELSPLYVILHETVLAAEFGGLTADTAANCRPYNYHIGEINIELFTFYGQRDSAPTLRPRRLKSRKDSAGE